MNENLRSYMRMATPPDSALKPIEGGNLKGKSDINPQWRIEVMTEVYGSCGIGWKYDIKSTREIPCPDGRIILYMGIELAVRENGEWSAPIPAYGGDFIIDMAKGQLVPNDEAYKMALTDALGSAMRVLGVAADVYRGLKDGKYNSRDARRSSMPEPKPPVKAPAKPATKPVQQQEAPSYVKDYNGKTCVFVENKWRYLEKMSLEELNCVINDAKYQKAHAEARQLMSKSA